MRLEGLVPDESDSRLQAQYVQDTKTLGDLYQHALDFAKIHQQMAP
jgi:hypothetical protein